MLTISKTLTYYKREDIRKAMVENIANKEVVVRYGDRFGKRPDTLQYPNDILEVVKKRATSFHASEEVWKNPLQLKTDLRRTQLDELRKGWDLVLDIDCHFLEYSKLAADLVIGALKYAGINSVSCKFSGNKGFHIGVPNEAFPDKIGGQEVKDMFPEAPRRIAQYIKELIKEPLSKKILESEKGFFQNIIKKTGMKAMEITRFVMGKFGDKIPQLNAEPFLDIDTILISSRHLYRMEYSFNEKSGLISIPINPNKVLEFDMNEAKPENVKVSRYKFLDRSNAKKTEGRSLMVRAFDFEPAKREEEHVETKRKYEMPEKAVSEESFPPCIRKGLKGLEDGRKRFVFIMCNFLGNLGWEYDNIEKMLKEWNKKNSEELRENIIISQVRYRKAQKKTILPPNCDKKMYYVDMGICKPDNLCSRIRNPVNYTIRKSWGIRRKKK